VIEVRSRGASEAGRRTRSWLVAGLALAILLSPALVAFVFDWTDKGPGLALHSLLLSASLVLLPLLFLGLRWYLLLASPLLVVASIELLHLGEFHSYITLGGVAALIETSFNEALEFIRFRVAYPALGLVLIGLYFFLVISRVRPDLKLPPLARLALLSCALVAVAVQPEAKYPSIKSADRFSTAFLERDLKKSYPLSFVNSISYYLKERRLLDNALAKRSWTFGEISKAAVEGREVHILIIGETSRAASWEVYGYHRPTSPRMVALRDAGELIAFDDAVSSCVLTRSSVPMMLTRATTHDLSPIFEERSLLSIFARSGFSVHWFSNQQKYGNHNRIISEITMEIDERSFLNVNTMEYGRGGTYDEQLLPELEAALGREGESLFIVLHTLGSHYNYHYRYPEEFAVYRPVPGEGSFAITPKASGKQKVINSYDNSILYTDYFLDEVIRRVRKADAVSTVTFLSDHGENLYDDERQIWGHGLPRPTRYSVHIPLFVWMSERFRGAYPEKVENLRANARRPVSLDSLFYTLPDVAGIRFEGWDASSSLASGAFREHERFVLTATKEVRPVSSLR
jgi:glucan phosphoethanolaminetransferase (alkaline phosphatase superfamily)